MSQQSADFLRLKHAILALEKMQAKLDAVERAQSEPIAIIGLGCRFPGGANDPESFWQLLRDGVDTVRVVPKTRWDIDAYYVADPEAPNKMYVREGAFLDDALAEGFDADFFGIAPREAVSLDPQQRLLLEVTWEALEHAGLAPDQLRNRYPKTGVYVGLMTTDYVQLSTAELDPYIGTGNGLSFPAGRLSYLLGTQGPSMVVATACSSSLVATHLACQALRRKECDMALVGGVSLMLSPRTNIVLSKMRALASDGRCKTFSAKADGYGRGEGCGMVVLKRVSSAQADGDKILALIRGSAVNHDGPSGGLTVPNGPAQEKLLRQALANAKVKPADVSYVETHGTGTSLGDPLEIRALGKVMGDRATPLLIGAVKTNIGHLEAAAGVAGLIKVVLSLQHGEIPPHLHFDEPNPHIPWDEWPLKVSTGLCEWPDSGSESHQRIAGVSSFGLSGINAHLVVEGFKGHNRESAPSQITHSPGQLLCLSAKTESALEALSQRYVEHLRTHEASLNWADACFTANTGRAHFDHRLSVVAPSVSEACQKLAEGKGGGIYRGKVSSVPQIAFLFTGQGSQYVGMGKQLYESQPVFRQTLERCDELLRVHTGLNHSLLEIMFDNTKAGTMLLHQTMYTQPALFALEYALAEMWKSWGIEPDVVMGHSVGEYVAACVAGIFSLEDGLKLIAERGRLMQALPEGAGTMAVLFANERLVATVIEPYARYLSIAAINGPKNVVISGRRQAAEAVVGYLSKKGIKGTTLTVSHAFHSPLMEPILTPFKRVARSISYSAPQLTFISNLTGEAVNEALDAEYWTRHIREPVNFAAGMNYTIKLAVDTFVEIGPKPVLLGMGRRIAHSQAGEDLPEVEALWLPTLREPLPEGGIGDWQQVLNSLGQLYVRGVEVNWSGFHVSPHQKIDLPTYPFERKPYWLSGASPPDLGIPGGRDSRGASRQQGTFYSAHSAHSADSADSSAHLSTRWTPLFELLDQGESQQIVRQVTEEGKFEAEQLELLPELLDFLMKQHQSQLTAASIKEWLYEIEWQAKPLGENRRRGEPPQGMISEEGSWLILSDRFLLAEVLAQQLEEQKQRCLIRNVGENIQPVEVPLKAVIYLSSAVGYLSSLDAGKPDKHDPYQQALDGCGNLLHLVQTLATQQGAGIIVPKLWVVTRGAVTVPEVSTSSTGDSHFERDGQLADASLWGLGRVVALEHPQLWGGMLDLAPSVTSESNHEEEAATVLAEMMAADGESQLAYRDGQRYVARLVRSDTSYLNTNMGQVPTTTLHAEASYLVTGGLGALGLVSARFLVEQGARHLILTGRRGVASEAAQQAVNQLREAGAKVDVIKADVSKREDVARVLVESTSPLGIKGIIHAAGVLDDGILLRQNVARFEKVMAAKIKGAWNLHTLTAESQLDFFVLFSSVASLLGSPGQGNYAAANAFMDALAHHRQAQGVPALSINWGPWAEEGMAAQLQVRRDAQAVTLITPAQGQQILAQSLFSNQPHTYPATPQIGVLPIDWSHFPRTPFLSELLPAPERQESFRQELDAADDPQAFLMAYLRREVANVLGRTDLPEPTRGFADMGMDSLMGLTFTNRLETNLEIALPATLALEQPTIERLAHYLANEILLLPAPSPPQNALDAPLPGDSDLFARAAQLEALSEEEAEALLRATLAAM